MLYAIVIRLIDNYRHWKWQYRVMDKRGMHWDFYRYKWHAGLVSKIIRGYYYPLSAYDKARFHQDSLI